MVAGGQEGAGGDGVRVRPHTCDTGGRVPFYEFLIAVTIAACISMATFRHADRNGNTHATAWGIGAFLAAGIVVPLYVVQVWLRRRRHGASP